MNPESEWGNGTSSAVVCPSCHKPSATIAADRPLKLPRWACPHCGYKQYGDQRDEPEPGFWRRMFKLTREDRICRRFIDRLASKYSNHANREIATLAAIGEDAVPALAEVLDNRRAPMPAVKSAMEALAKIATDKAIHAIARIVELRQIRFRFAKNGANDGAWMALSLAGMAVSFGLYHENLVLGLLPMAVACLAVLVFRSNRNAVEAMALQYLAGSPRPWAAGILAVAYQTDILSGAGGALKEVLPKVTDASAINEWQRQAIVTLCWNQNPQLAAGALHVVGLYGAERELQLVEKVGSQATNPEVKDAAAAAAQAIQRRLEQAKDRSTLLRASAGTDAAKRELLRPAGDPKEPVEQLLRSIDPDL